MGLCTLQNVKDLAGLTGTEDDAVITRIIDLVSNMIARSVGAFDPVAGSLLEMFVDRVEYHVGGDLSIDSQGWPIAAVAELVEAAVISDLDTAAALVEDEDFVVEAHRGRISRLYGGRAGRFLGGIKGVRLTYTGGYLVAGQSAPPGVTVPALPADVMEAACFQAQHMFEHKDHLGERSFNVGTATIDSVEQRLLPFVSQDIIADLRRTNL